MWIKEEQEDEDESDPRTYGPYPHELGEHRAETDHRGQQKKFRCSTCNRKFSVYTSLYRHSRYECNQQPRFGCYYCSYRTKQTTSVYQHIRRMHRGSEPACIDVLRNKVVKRRVLKPELDARSRPRNWTKVGSKLVKMRRETVGCVRF